MLQNKCKKAACPFVCLQRAAGSKTLQWQMHRVTFRPVREPMRQNVVQTEAAMFLNLLSDT